MKHSHCLAIVALILGSSTHAFAQAEIALISPLSIRPVLDQLLPAFESKTGNKVKVTFRNGGQNKKGVAGGEAFDLAILQPPYPEVLASGNVVPGSAKQLAGVPIGIAVKQGAAKPDISTPEAAKKTLLAAKSIYYPDAASGAAAGVKFDETLRTLGIYDQIQAKVRRGSDAVAQVAKGEIEFDVTFLSEMTEPGIERVGPFPAAIATPIAVVGLISSHAKNPAGAKVLLDYLTSAEAAAVYKADFMIPGH